MIWRKECIHPMLPIVLVQFILFFKSTWCKTASGAKKWIKSAPQAAAFSSVFLLLLCITTIETTFKNMWKTKLNVKKKQLKNNFLSRWSLKNIFWEILKSQWTFNLRSYFFHSKDLVKVLVNGNKKNIYIGNYKSL